MALVLFSRSEVEPQAHPCLTDKVTHPRSISPSFFADWGSWLLVTPAARHHSWRGDHLLILPSLTAPVLAVMMMSPDSQSAV